MEIILVLGFCPLVTPTSGGFRLNITQNEPKARSRLMYKLQSMNVQTRNYILNVSTILKISPSFANFPPTI